MRHLVVAGLCVAGALPAVGQFAMQQSGTTASLRGIDSVGKGVAWASGTGGTVLRTVDGGKTWEHCAVPPDAEKLDFRGVQAFDAQTAIVMSSGKGDLSRLYKTVDGCRSWKLVFTNPDAEGFWDAMQFLPVQNLPNHQLEIDNKKGVLLGDPVNGDFSIFETSDGGQSWRQRIARKRTKESGCQIDTFPANKDEAVFAASNESLVFFHPYLFFFVTGGIVARLGYMDHFDLDFSFCHERAKYLNLPLKSGSAPTGAFAVAARQIRNQGSLEMMVVGGDYEQPNASQGTSALIAPASNAHSLFPDRVTISTPVTPVHGYRSAVAYDETTKAWITAGPNGTDVSTDDGKNWRALRPGAGDDPGADRDWNALSLPFVVGAKGRIGVLRAGVLEAK